MPVQPELSSLFNPIIAFVVVSNQPVHRDNMYELSVEIRLEFESEACGTNFPFPTPGSHFPFAAPFGPFPRYTFVNNQIPAALL